jgi:ethanolamine kinase
MKHEIVSYSSSGYDSALSLSLCTRNLIGLASLCRELCKDLFNKWSKLDDSRFSVETVSGGITNLCEYLT